MGEAYHRPDQKTLQALKDMANKLRIHSIESTNTAGSGHPTSCCSIAEIMSVLFFHTMRYKVSSPRDASSDRFILSKGHAAPILYAVWAEAGLFPVGDLAKLRTIDSDLEGHPTPRLDFVDFATGSLGQGLSCAAGMAYAGKYFDKASYRVFCVIGDAESAEGSVWEAINFASHYKLDNLCAIFDINRLGQSDPTMHQHDFDTYKKRTEAFGWNTIVIDGHEVDDVCRAFHEAKECKGCPTAILAKTYKGKGVPGVENLDGYHGKALGDKGKKAVEEIKALIANETLPLRPPSVIVDDAPKVDLTVKLSEPPNYKKGEKVAVRRAYANGLIKLGKTCERVIALDGDTKNSTYSLDYRKEFPGRHIECFVAEQNMIGVAMGCAARGRAITFSSTFAAFFTRAFDHLRMAAVSQTSANFCGSHCGVSIGVDGPSQMALEDLGMFRSIPNCVVFYPSDGVSCERAVELAANYKDMAYIRSTRGETPIVYENDESFEIGKAKIVRQNASDSVLVIGAGVTLTEALKAADELARESTVHIRVMDPFTLKPIDKAAIIEHAKAVGGKILTVEDHYIEGGIGETVCAAVAEETGITVRMLAVPRIPRSGPGNALLDLYGISAKHIVKTVKSL